MYVVTYDKESKDFNMVHSLVLFYILPFGIAKLQIEIAISFYQNLGQVYQNSLY